MATVPLSGTNIRLMKNVPFSNDYKHTRWFDTYEHQFNYFVNKPTVYAVGQANFQRIEGKQYIAVNKSIDELWGTNYLMFVNTSQTPETFADKWFYAFVTKLEYVQKSTTYVHFEIDVFQTWKFEMNFKPSYVVREHCKQWNADGSPITNTIDEGLDYGPEYDIVGANQYALNDGILFLVIVAKSTLHTLEGTPSAGYYNATVNGVVQPLCYYIHPFLPDGNTPSAEIDGEVYDMTPVTALINRIYSHENAVNNVVSMYLTDHVGVEVEYSTTGGASILFHTKLGQSLKGVSIPPSAIDPTGVTINTIFVEEMLQYENIQIACNPKYENYGGRYVNGAWNWAGVEESKLLMYPYTVTILDDFKGNRIVLRNEYIEGSQLLVDGMGSMGVSNKVAYIPKNYLTGRMSVPEGMDENPFKTQVAIENGVIDQSPHDVTVLTDMLSAFLQGNRNSLKNQAQTIGFNGTMAGIEGMAASLMSLSALNIGGVASGMIQGIKGMQNAIFQLQGIQAKIKDINNIPPSVSKMGSNTAFEYGNKYYGFWVIQKQVKPEYRKKLSDFFKMFGYKVNEVKIPNFHTRQSWNFVQTASCNITGNFNNDDLQELKSVFDNGITFWHTDDVGNYSLPNGVIS